jgi:serine/threonine-protein kinase
MRTIEKLPADRFPTAEALAEQLEEIALARWGRGDRLVVSALESAGLVTAADAAEPGGATAPLRRKRATVRVAIGGLAAIGAAAVAGGALLQTRAHREGQTAGSGPLELAPPSPGYLRVLATPWAEVWVDGQRVDETPFARGIPLAPGTHYVTLVHPNAPVEKRSVPIVSGETRTLDVVMAVPDLAPQGEGGAPEQSAEREKERK